MVKVKKDSIKNREWERRRRDRLTDAFKGLVELLPNYDPARIPPKINILQRSTQFIKELRLSNSRLLSSDSQPEELIKRIQFLQDEVNKLILRVKQLTVLLVQANIPIPTGPSIKSLGKRNLKWSNKLKADDIENVIPIASTTIVEPSMKDVSSAKSLQNKLSKKVENKKTKESVTEKNQKSSDKKIGKTVITVVRKDETETHLCSTTANDVIPSVSSGETSIPSVTQKEPSAVDKATLSTESSISPNSQPESNAQTQSGGVPFVTKSITLPIRLQTQTPTFVLAPLSTHQQQSIFLSLPSATTVPTFQLPILSKVCLPTSNLQKIPIKSIKRSVPVKQKRKRAPRKKSLKQKLKKRDGKIESSTQTTNSSVEIIEVDADEASRKGTDVESTPIRLESDSVEVHGKNIAEEEKETLDSDSAKEIVVGGSGRADNLPDEKSEVDISSTVSVIVDITNEGNANSIVNNGFQSVSTAEPVKNAEVSSIIEEIEREISDHSESIVPVENSHISDDNNQSISKTSLASKSSNFPDAEPSTSISIHHEHPQTNNEFQPGLSLKSSIPTNVGVTKNSVSESNPNPIPVTSSSSYDGNELTKNTLSRIEGSPPLSSEKISECIARSIGLIEASEEAETELMELGTTDWGDVVGVGDDGQSHSPKSISPTQMFLSMFPLLPRDGFGLTTELSSQQNASASSKVLNTSCRSSFDIDSMLPDSHQNPAISFESLLPLRNMSPPLTIGPLSTPIPQPAKAGASTSELNEKGRSQKDLFSFPQFFSFGEVLSHQSQYQVQPSNKLQTSQDEPGKLSSKSRVSSSSTHTTTKSTITQSNQNTDFNGPSRNSASFLSGDKSKSQSNKHVQNHIINFNPSSLPSTSAISHQIPTVSMSAPPSKMTQGKCSQASQRLSHSSSLTQNKKQKKTSTAIANQSSNLHQEKSVEMNFCHQQRNQHRNSTVIEKESLNRTPMKELTRVNQHHPSNPVVASASVSANRQAAKPQLQNQNLSHLSLVQQQNGSSASASSSFSSLASQPHRLPLQNAQANSTNHILNPSEHRVRNDFTQSQVIPSYSANDFTNFLSSSSNSTPFFSNVTSKSNPIYFQNQFEQHRPVATETADLQVSSRSNFYHSHNDSNNTHHQHIPHSTHSASEFSFSIHSAPQPQSQQLQQSSRVVSGSGGNYGRHSHKQTQNFVCSQSSPRHFTSNFNVSNSQQQSIYFPAQDPSVPSISTSATSHSQQNHPTISNFSSNIPISVPVTLHQETQQSQQRPVNWMTDSQYKKGPQQERNSNPFSVSKLVGGPSNTTLQHPTQHQHHSGSSNRNHCAETLIRTSQSSNNNNYQITSGGAPPSVADARWNQDFQPQSNLQHHQVEPRQFHPIHSSNPSHIQFDYSSRLSSSSGPPMPNPPTQRFPVPDLNIRQNFTGHLDSLHSNHSSTISHQTHTDAFHPGSTTGSISNFNLSSIFPEINNGGGGRGNNGKTSGNCNYFTIPYNSRK